MAQEPTFPADHHTKGLPWPHEFRLTAANPDQERHQTAVNGTKRHQKKFFPIFDGAPDVPVRFSLSSWRLFDVGSWIARRTFRLDVGRSFFSTIRAHSRSFVLNRAHFRRFSIFHIPYSI